MDPGSRKRKASTDPEEEDNVEDTAYSLPPEEQEDDADDQQQTEDDFDEEVEDDFDEHEYDGDEELEDDFDQEQDDDFDEEQQDDNGEKQQEDDNEQQQDDYEQMQEDDYEQRQHKQQQERDAEDGQKQDDDDSGAVQQDVDDFAQQLEKMLIVEDEQPMIEPEQAWSLSDLDFTDDDDEPLAKRPRFTHTIIIEHCTSPICNAILQQKAFQVKEALERGVPDVLVKINPQTPRINYFEVRFEDGKVIISFKDLRRPFLQVVDLDMERLLDAVRKSIFI